MRLQVPLIRQPARNACWYAAAEMVAAYRGMALPPRESLGEAGIMAWEYVQLARAAGLSVVPNVPPVFDAAFFRDALTTYGPLWAAGQWTDRGQCGEQRGETKTVGTEHGSPRHGRACPGHPRLP